MPREGRRSQTLCTGGGSHKLLHGAQMVEVAKLRGSAKLCLNRRGTIGYLQVVNMATTPLQSQGSPRVCAGRGRHKWLLGGRGDKVPPPPPPPPRCLGFPQRSERGEEVNMTT